MADDATSTGSLNPGSDLRAAREARGLSVHQVAVELHVSDAFIDALERADYAVLGGPVFVRGHLRNYARAVGVAEEPILAAYEHNQNKPTAPSLMAQPTIGTMSSRNRTWSMRVASAAVVLVLIILAVSWWQRRPDEPAAAQPLVVTPATPAPTAATQPMASLTDLRDTPVTTPSPAVKPAAPAAQPPLAVAQTRPAAAPVTHSTHLGPPAPVANAPQQVSIGPSEGKNLTHVSFTMGAASWVEVYDATGKRLFYDLAPAGNTLDLSGAGPLQVFLGYAPGVSIQLNGAPFDLKPYARSDNTARFKLGDAGN